MENNNLLCKSFAWMGIGLLVTFLTGFGVAHSEVMLENIFSNGFWIIIIAELALVIFLSARIMKMKPITAKISFLLYSFVSGLTFSSVFVVYELTSVMIVFLITAFLFGFMSFLGYVTKVNLSKIGTYLLVALLGVILVSIINIFLEYTMLDLIISIICVLLFVGITAYDVQKIKSLEGSGLPEDNLAIYGALELYLDFINIFLHLLSIFGRSDD